MALFFVSALLFAGAAVGGVAISMLLADCWPPRLFRRLLRAIWNSVNRRAERRLQRDLETTALWAWWRGIRRAGGIVLHDGDSAAFIYERAKLVGPMLVPGVEQRPAVQFRYRGDGNSDARSDFLWLDEFDRARVVSMLKMIEEAFDARLDGVRLVQQSGVSPEARAFARAFTGPST